MGVDMYLESIYGPFLETYKNKAKGKRLRLETADEIQQAAEAVFDDLRASGAYFRNGYNAGDLMWAMGTSWAEQLGKKIGPNGRLPIDKARELLAVVEAQPLTKERVAEHMLRHMTSGRDEYPGYVNALIDQIRDDDRPLAPPDFEYLFAFLTARRDGLIALLRKSIELGEPLVCSL